MDEQTKALAKLGGRKFTVTMTVVLVASLALWLKLIGESTWASVVMTISGAYMASNVAQKYVLKETTGTTTTISTD